MQKNKELSPWQMADLPEPPMPRGLSWIGVCGPGVIVPGGALADLRHRDARQRFLLTSMPLPTGMSTESMSPAARTRAR